MSTAAPHNTEEASLTLSSAARFVGVVLSVIGIVLLLKTFAAFDVATANRNWSDYNARLRTAVPFSVAGILLLMQLRRPQTALVLATVNATLLVAAFLVRVVETSPPAPGT